MTAVRFLGVVAVALAVWFPAPGAANPADGGAEGHVADLRVTGFVGPMFDWDIHSMEYGGSFGLGARVRSWSDRHGHAGSAHFEGRVGFFPCCVQHTVGLRFQPDSGPITPFVQFRGGTKMSYPDRGPLVLPVLSTGAGLVIPARSPVAAVLEGEFEVFPGLFTFVCDAHDDYCRRAVPLRLTVGVLFRI